MTNLYSADEAIGAVARLTHTQLIAFVEAQIVIPMQSENGPVYGQMDLVRLELLCELSEEFELDDDALGIVISLIDQLHGVRAELRALTGAIANEPADVRARVSEVVQLARSSE